MELKFKEFFKLDKQKRESAILNITQSLRRQPEVIFAYLHGSFLDNDNLSFRDIDIAIYLKPEYLKNKKSVLDYELSLLTNTFISYPLDVKVLNVAPFSFQSSVYRKGRLLFSKNYRLLEEELERISLVSVAEYPISIASFKELTS